MEATTADTTRFIKQGIFGANKQYGMVHANRITD